MMSTQYHHASSQVSSNLPAPQFPSHFQVPMNSDASALGQSALGRTHFDEDHFEDGDRPKYERATEVPQSRSLTYEEQNEVVGIAKRIQGFQEYLHSHGYITPDQSNWINTDRVGTLQYKLAFPEVLAFFWEVSEQHKWLSQNVTQLSSELVAEKQNSQLLQLQKNALRKTYHRQIQNLVVSGAYGSQSQSSLQQHQQEGEHPSSAYLREQEEGQQQQQEERLANQTVDYSLQNSMTMLNPNSQAQLLSMDNRLPPVHQAGVIYQGAAEIPSSSQASSRLQKAQVGSRPSTDLNEEIDRLREELRMKTEEAASAGANIVKLNKQLQSWEDMLQMSIKKLEEAEERVRVTNLQMDSKREETLNLKKEYLTCHKQQLASIKEISTLLFPALGKRTRRAKTKAATTFGSPVSSPTSSQVKRDIVTLGDQTEKECFPSAEALQKVRDELAQEFKSMVNKVEVAVVFQKFDSRSLKGITEAALEETGELTKQLASVSHSQFSTKADLAILAKAIQEYLKNDYWEEPVGLDPLTMGPLVEAVCSLKSRAASWRALCKEKEIALVDAISSLKVKEKELKDFKNMMQAHQKILKGKLVIRSESQIMRDLDVEMDTILEASSKQTGAARSHIYSPTSTANDVRSNDFQLGNINQLINDFEKQPSKDSGRKSESVGDSQAHQPVQKSDNCPMGEIEKPTRPELTDLQEGDRLAKQLYQIRSEEFATGKDFYSGITQGLPGHQPEETEYSLNQFNRKHALQQYFSNDAMLIRDGKDTDEVPSNNEPNRYFNSQLSHGRNQLTQQPVNPPTLGLEGQLISNEQNPALQVLKEPELSKMVYGEGHHEAEPQSYLLNREEVPSRAAKFCTIPVHGEQFDAPGDLLSNEQSRQSMMDDHLIYSKSSSFKELKGIQPQGQDKLISSLVSKESLQHPYAQPQYSQYPQLKQAKHLNASQQQPKHSQTKPSQQLQSNLSSIAKQFKKAKKAEKRPEESSSTFSQNNPSDSSSFSSGPAAKILRKKLTTRSGTKIILYKKNKRQGSKSIDFSTQNPYQAVLKPLTNVKQDLKESKEDQRIKKLKQFMIKRNSQSSNDQENVSSNRQQTTSELPTESEPMTSTEKIAEPELDTNDIYLQMMMKSNKQDRRDNKENYFGPHLDFTEADNANPSLYNLQGEPDLVPSRDIGSNIKELAMEVSADMKDQRLTVFQELKKAHNLESVESSQGDDIPSVNFIEEYLAFQQKAKKGAERGHGGNTNDGEWRRHKY